MPNLPHDIIIDILSRLPIKSLCRFKCVSKPWRTLISNLDFTIMHLTRTQKQKLILAGKTLYSVDPKPSTDTELEAVKLHHPLKVDSGSLCMFGSCNGLVGIVRLYEYDFFVFNPSTRESLKIPDFPIPPPIGIADKIIYGLGYAPSIDDYKFVRVAYATTIDVYSLKTKSWRRLLEKFPDYYPYLVQGTPLNGAIHWGFLGKGPDENFNFVILAFDLVEETFRQVPQPDCFDDEDGGDYDLLLGVLEGCLCICNHDLTKVNEFWVMKEYGVKESWTKMAIAVPDLLDLPIYLSNVLQPICLLKDHKILAVVNDKRFVLGNPEDGTCEDVVVHNIPNSFTCDTYVESLVSPNFGNWGSGV